MDSAHIAQLTHADHAHIWHPFTQMRDWQAEDPIIIERGEGAELIDVEGRRYLDGVSSLWVNVHGHRCAAIDDAVRAQLDRIAHSTLLGLANVPSIEFADALIDAAPTGLTRVFYSDSGSTAVEVALKMAFQYWQQRGDEASRKKTRFLKFANAYHGDTIGSVSVGGIDLFHSMYRPLLFDAFTCEYPHPYRTDDATSDACRDRCLAQLEAQLKQHAYEIAAVVIEPLVQGAAGMVTAPRGFLKGVEKLCHEHDVLLICDEVATGFGRTSKLFAVEHEDVHPDFLCVAKGITGGYLPLAATLTTDAVHDGFLGEYADLRTFFHGHTYTGNPLACAAAIASLDLLQRDLLPKLPAAAEHFDTLLRERLGPLAHVGDIRGVGLMRGAELVRNCDTKEPYDWVERIAVQVCGAARKHGAILRPLGNVVVLMPVLAMTHDELTRLVDIVATSIREVTDV